jgi:diadenosine tetraphosphate (Ap4A) HIT family hydrolase
VTACPFCQRLASGDGTEANSHAVAFSDAFPVAAGHTLVVPRRHVASVFDLAAEEYAALWALVAAVRARLAAASGADGFTIGVNDGAAAGQTVAHAHVHVIPRRAGDVPDPRGGVRWVLPERAAYWEGEK